MELLRRSMTRRSLPAYSPDLEEAHKKLRHDILGIHPASKTDELLSHSSSGEWVSTKHNERTRRKSVCLIGNERTAIISALRDKPSTAPMPLRRSRNLSTSKKHAFCFVEPALSSVSSMDKLRFQAGSVCSYEILPGTSVLIAFEYEEAYENYYTTFFLDQEHYNWCGNTVKDEYYVVSVLKQPESDEVHGNVYRTLVRSPEGDKRIFIAEVDKHIKDPKQKMKQFIKDAFNLTELKRAKIPNFPKLLQQFEKKNVIEHSKIGILYRKEGQMNEDQMFNNQETSDDFKEFLSVVGEEVLLHNFPRYRGGLDIKYNSTGTSSYFCEFNDLEIMFHVAPLLPHFQYDKQQVEKKRHLGNDIVMIVFDESGLPFDHSIVSSQFNQIFAVVSPIVMKGSQRKMYKLEMSVKPGNPKFGPYFPPDIVFERGPAFRDLLLTKVLNGERAACKGAAFAPKIKRTRNQLLEEITLVALKK